MRSSPKENTTTGLSRLDKTDKGLPAINNFSVKHAMAHVEKVRSTISATNAQVEEYVALIAQCQLLVDQLSDKSMNSNEELLKNLKTIFEKIYENFTVQVTLQRQENEKMQQKIDKLKKEKTEVQQIIIGCAKKCAELEQDLGKYPH